MSKAVEDPKARAAIVAAFDCLASEPVTGHSTAKQQRRARHRARRLVEPLRAASDDASTVADDRPATYPTAGPTISSLVRNSANRAKTLFAD